MKSAVVWMLLGKDLICCANPKSVTVVRLTARMSVYVGCLRDLKPCHCRVGGGDLRRKSKIWCIPFTFSNKAPKPCVVHEDMLRCQTHLAAFSEAPTHRDTGTT